MAGIFYSSLVRAIPHEYQSIVDKVKTVTLKNGFTLLIAERGHAPVFTGQIWVKVGSADEEWGKSGSAHLLEHMAFKGTKEIGTTDYEKESALLKRQEEIVVALREKEDSALKDELEKVESALSEIWVSGEYTKLLEQRGAKGLNAATSADYTMYTMSLPSQQLEFWFQMESARLKKPVFRQFYKELNVVLEERRMRTEDQPSGKLYEALLASAFWNHPYQQPTIGWKNDLIHLTKKDAEDLHKKFYQPKNMVIVVVGDVDADKVSELANQYFGDIESKDSYLHRKPAYSHAQEGERMIKVSYKSAPEFLIGFHKPTYPEPESAHLSLLYSILDEGRSSPFQKKLVQQDKILSSVYTTEAPGERYTPLFIVGGTPSQGYSYEQCITAIDRILQNIDITEEMLASAKKRIKFQIISGLGTNTGLSSYIGKRQLLYGNWKDLFNEIEQIDSTRVEDVLQAAKKYLNKDNRTITLIDNTQN